MPLKKGSSRETVSENIREFRTGPTFAHTAQKFGKERAQKQAVAVALSTARKYGKGKAGGGSLFPMESAVIRGSMYGLRHEGMIKSAIPGRTDKIPMSVRSGSYILPADIPSALGQGNTMAGGEILKKMFTSGPYGMAPMHGGSGRPFAGKLPPAPKMPGMGTSRKTFGFANGGAADEPDVSVTAPGSMVDQTAPDINPSGPFGKAADDRREWDAMMQRQHQVQQDHLRRFGPTGQESIDPSGRVHGFADGGEADDESDSHVPIIAAGGEFIIHPDVVRDIGHGDIDKGHKVLDKFVLHVRNQNIKTLRKLKPPKK